MKRIVLPLNNSVSMSLCFLSLFVATSSIAAPRVHCDAPKYNFGTVIGQEKITHEFILRNRGDEPLVISKIKNCCGVESKVVPKTIPPGSNAVCTAVFTTKNRYGSQDKQILLITNDKKHPYFDLRLTGTLLKPVEFSPRWIRLGNLTAGSEIHQTITATNMLEQAVTLDSVQSTVRGIVAEVVGGEGDPARSWTIEVKSSEALPVGKLNGQIQLNFSSGTVTVPIIGTVKPMIQMVPAQIELGSATIQRMERLVMLRSARAFRVEEVTLEGFAGTVETKKISALQWRLKIRMEPQTLTTGAQLKIHTDCEFQPELLVPLNVRVR